MKPNFALTLSFEGIGLLHRAFLGWHLVGDVALDVDDLAEELSAVRQKAQLLDPSGLRSKLVLPNDQLKYLQLDAPSDDQDITAAVIAALEGATPYAVDDLAYDWALKDGRLYIAAVARETLAEAEAFAVEHQFNPVIMVAQPDSTDYAGEPCFGLTQHALSDGVSDEDVTRDTAPVRIIGASKLPEPESAGSPEDEQSPPPEDQDDPFDTEPDDPAPADEAEDAPSTAFSSIRAQRGDAGSAPPKLEGVVRDTAPPRFHLGPADDQTPTDSTVSVTGISDAALPEDDVAAASPAIRPVIEDRLKQATFAEPAPAPKPVPLAPPDDTDEPSFATRRSPSAARPAPVNAVMPDDERQRMTVFGAREDVAVRGKPRFLGLILTAILLLFLIGVAAWASIFLDEGIARFFRADDPPAVATLPDTEDELIAETEIELASLEPDEPISVLDDPATAILSRVNPSDLSPDEAKARYAATGIWQLAPEPSDTPTTTDMEDFYLTSLDPNLGFQDAVALPDPLTTITDGVFFTPPSPPSADTKFVLDSRGFVLATKDGVLTPDAVLVFAGKPLTVMPDRLKRGEPAAEPEQPVATAQLAALRPKQRPQNASEQIERNELSGRTRNELAALRPKLRPESAQEAAEEARKAAELAKAEATAAAQASTVDLDALEAAVAEAAALPDPFAGATAQAVSASLKPSTRPRDFDTIVQRIKRNQQSQQAQSQDTDETQSVQVAAAQKITPKIPTATSVSKQATQRNALKFKRVNLIGVYGTPSNRRALVRMGNGRYKKVKVGDRLDGGKVSAIGDSELRYKKGGRSVVLKLPRG